ncbi:MAG: branched-chain amino acid ABC transporter substrate-binding protein, partial [Burkholderiales bacterium]|nr:branched-chain amino acid ABC transporter substrate-binding protein [Burkholderiales bacterium]
MKRAAVPLATALGAIALNVLAALAAPGAAAAEFKLVLLARADDPRLERARVERAAPGHPQGPAADAVQMALRDSARALEAAKAALALQIVEVADAEAARAA